MSQVSYDFSGKVALVTGATGGIGRKIARMFGEAGARVAVSGRRANEGEETVAMIRDAGGEAFFHAADIMHEADIAALVAATVERYGALHYGINNAGAAMMASIDELSVEDWDYEIARNSRSAFLGIKHQMPAMRAAGGGAIVNMASTAAALGIQRMAAYCAAKAAVVGLTRGAAAEGAGQGIRVNAIQIGPVRSDAWAGTPDDALARVAAAVPMGRMGQVGEIAHAALWLCSDAASFITGICVPVDGGSTSIREGQRTAGN